MRDVDSFFDTSVVLYLLSEDAAKADRAEELLTRSGVISVQVLNEFVAVATRKLAMPFADVVEILGTVREVCRADPVTVECHDKGVEIAQRYGFSLYDSVIVASALLGACKTLYSEDLQHLQVIDGQLTVVNPFVPAPSAPEQALG
jgi:predicted nucleic acid-binding protein